MSSACRSPWLRATVLKAASVVGQACGTDTPEHGSQGEVSDIPFPWEGLGAGCRGLLFPSLRLRPSAAERALVAQDELDLEKECYRGSGLE